MSDIIRVPVSICPLHLGHEYFLNELMDKTGKKILVALQGGEKILENLEQKFGKNPENEKIVELLKKTKEQNDFLSVEERKLLLNEFNHEIKFSQNSFINKIKTSEFEGNAIGSDILYKFCELLKKGGNLKDDKILKFKKLYIIEREGYPIPKDYKKIIEKTGYEIEVEIIGKSSFNISGSIIRKIYSEEGILGIKKYISQNIFNILKNIKS